MTITEIPHGTTQMTLQTSVLANQMSKQERDQLEATALVKENTLGVGNVFTIDSSGEGLPPRGKRGDS